MSRCCEITISVFGFDADRCQEIVDAVGGLGYDPTFSEISKGQIQFCPEVINISSGHSEESVAREIVEAIWKANSAFCTIHVKIRDLDINIPQYSWDKVSFDEWDKNPKLSIRTEIDFIVVEDL